MTGYPTDDCFPDATNFRALQGSKPRLPIAVKRVQLPKFAALSL
jgi:hypothetical protein